MCDLWKVDEPVDKEKQWEPYHKGMVHELQRQWDTVGVALNGCPAITSLHIDVKGLYCPMMCCRTELIEDLFAHYMPAVKADVDVTVRSSMDGTHYDMMIAWRTRGLAEEERAMALAHTTYSDKGDGLVWPSSVRYVVESVDDAEWDKVLVDPMMEMERSGRVSC